MTAPIAFAPPVGAVGRPAWLRSPVGLSRAAVALLGLVIATDLFAIWADFLQFDVAGDLADGAYGAGLTRRAHSADATSGAAGVAQLGALLASAVVYLCWFHRVRVNAEVFDRSAQSLRRGWAIGGWFTPVVSLWYPRRVTVDIWDASAPAGRPRSHALVNAWWTLWLGSLFLGRLTASGFSNADDAAELRDSAEQMLLADAVDIVGAVLAICLVLTLTRMQHHKALAGPVPSAF